MENSVDVPQKAEKRVSMWCNNPTPGLIPRQDCNLKRHTHPSVHSGPIWNSPDTETTHWQTNGHRRCGTYAQGDEKGQSNAHCSNMDGPGDYYTEWSPKENRQIPYDTTYMWNLKYDTDEPTYEQKHRQNSLVARRVGTEGGTERGLRSADISFYRQNRETTGSHSTAQRTMFSIRWYTIMEKNIKKRMYICKWATFLYSRNQSIINQLYFNIKNLIKKIRFWILNG